MTSASLFHNDMVCLERPLLNEAAGHLKRAIQALPLDSLKLIEVEFMTDDVCIPAIFSDHDVGSLAQLRCVS